MPDRFLVEQRPGVRGAATHAIVIGVGHYPHLPGGGARAVRKPEGMTQLSSPPYSARAFAAWLIANLKHPDKPLGSVALLISERRPKPFRNPLTNKNHVVEIPTIENLREAIREWRQRGGTAQDRLLFYFCGHGIGKGSDTALLAADYGVDPDDPLDAAIDFRNFLAGMAQVDAEEQVYFVDACRVHSGSLLNAGGYNGRPIIQPNVALPDNPNLRVPVFYSTLAGSAAFGQERKPSVFTEALLHGFEGAGAVDDAGEGKWRITALGLKGALDFALGQAVTRLGRAQVPVTDNAVPIELHHVPGTPLGTAIVKCRPPDATPDATFSWALGGKVQRRPGGKRGEWVVELPTDQYEFRAEFAGGRWRAAPQKSYIRPVSKQVELETT